MTATLYITIVTHTGTGAGLVTHIGGVGLYAAADVTQALDALGARQGSRGGGGRHGGNGYSCGCGCGCGYGGGGLFSVSLTSCEA